jgi:hypothetical protein
MTSGSLTIQKLSNMGSNVAIYQVLFEDLPGNLFAGSMGRDELNRLLTHDLSLVEGDEDVAEILSGVDRGSSATLEDVTLSEQDLVGAGLHYLPQAG